MSKTIIKTAVIRKDLRDKHEAVPVGNGYYSSSALVEYRWTEDDQFQVFIFNAWLDAESADFEF